MLKKNENKPTSKRAGSWATVRSLGFTVFVVLMFRAFVAEAYFIPSGSMEPSLLVGDRLVVSKASYGLRVPLTDRWIWRWGEPRRGEVVLFSDLRGLGDTLIKRVIALAGDRLEIRDNTVHVNGKPIARWPLSEPCSMERGGGEGGPCRRYGERNGTQAYRVQQQAGHEPLDSGETIVPPGHFFAMGDNRDDSCDSRFWGSVPYERLRGRALAIYWSWGPEGLRTERLGQSIHK